MDILSSVTVRRVCLGLRFIVAGTDDLPARAKRCPPGGRPRRHSGPGSCTEHTSGKDPTGGVGFSITRDWGEERPRLVGTLLSLAVPAAPVFEPEELDLLAPVLSKALAQARPDQRVAFTYWSAKPVRRNAPLAGAIAVSAPYLRFTLDEHPTIGWQDPEDPSAPKLFELEFVRPGFVRVANEDKQKRSRRSRPMLEIDYVRFLQQQPGDASSAAVRRAPDVATSAVGSGDTAVKAPAPTVRQEVDVEDLRREIKELTLSNQELRAKMRELSDQLAETRQLLGEKVLELDRLNKRSAVPRRPNKTPGGR